MNNKEILSIFDEMPHNGVGSDTSTAITDEVGTSGKFILTEELTQSSIRKGVTDSGYRWKGILLNGTFKGKRASLFVGSSDTAKRAEQGITCIVIEGKPYVNKSGVEITPKTLSVVVGDTPPPPPPQETAKQRKERQARELEAKKTLENANQE